MVMERLEVFEGGEGFPGLLADGFVAGDGEVGGEGSEVITGPTAIVVGVDEFARGEVAGDLEPAFGGEAVAEVAGPDFAMKPIGLCGEGGLSEFDFVQAGPGEDPDMVLVVDGEAEDVIIVQPSFAGIVSEAGWFDTRGGGDGVGGVAGGALEESAAGGAKPGAVRCWQGAGEFRPGSSGGRLGGGWRCGGGVGGFAGGIGEPLVAETIGEVTVGGDADVRRDAAGKRAIAAVGSEGGVEESGDAFIGEDIDDVFLVDTDLLEGGVGQLWGELDADGGILPEGGVGNRCGLGEPAKGREKEQGEDQEGRNGGPV